MVVYLMYVKQRNTENTLLSALSHATSRKISPWNSLIVLKIKRDLKRTPPFFSYEGNGLANIKRKFHGHEQGCKFKINTSHPQ